MKSPAPKKNWYFLSPTNEPVGPYSKDEIRELIETRRIPPDARVRKGAAGPWKRADRFEALVGGASRPDGAAAGSMLLLRLGLGGVGAVGAILFLLWLVGAFGGGAPAPDGIHANRPNPPQQGNPGQGQTAPPNASPQGKNPPAKKDLQEEFVFLPLQESQGSKYRKKIGANTLALTFSQDGTTLTALNVSIRAWKSPVERMLSVQRNTLPAGKLAELRQLHLAKSDAAPYEVLPAAPCPDRSRFLLRANAEDGTKSSHLVLWDSLSGKGRNLAELEALDRGRAEVAFSGKGNLVVTGGRNRIHLLETETGQVHRGFSLDDLARDYQGIPGKFLFPPRPDDLHPCTITGCLSADGRTLATIGQNHGPIEVRTPGDPKPRRLAEPLPVGYASLHHPAFSPDGNWLVVAENKLKESVVLLEATNSKAAFDFAEKAGKGADLLLLDVSAAVPPRRLTFPGCHDVHCLAFSPDGKFLAAGGAFGKVLVWDFEKKERFAAFEVTDETRAEMKCLAWSPDSRLLAVGGTSVIHPRWSPTTLPSARKPSILVFDVPNRTTTCVFPSEDLE